MENKEILKEFASLRVSVARIEEKQDAGFSALKARMDSLEQQKRTLVDCLTAHEKKTLEAKTLAEGAGKGVGALWTAGIALASIVTGAIIGLYHWIIQHIGGGKP